MWDVVYGFEDCAAVHEDGGPYHLEGAAEEQAVIHNGLCPHYGLPMKCARVRKRQPSEDVADVTGVSSA